MNVSDPVALWPPGVVTRTSTGPAEPAGLVAVIVVLLILVTVTDWAGVEPKSTLEPCVNPVPVTVTCVPPASGPAFGETEATVGIGS